MFAAVRRYEGITDPDAAAELVDLSFMPLLEHLSGFVAYVWIDAGDGTMASLSIFESKEEADKSVEIAQKWVRDFASELFPNPPRVTEGHVVARARTRRSAT